MVNAGSYSVSFDGQLELHDGRRREVWPCGRSWCRDLWCGLHRAVFGWGRLPSYYEGISAASGRTSPHQGRHLRQLLRSSQQSALPSFHTQAKTCSANSAAYMNAGARGSRYTTWFAATPPAALQHGQEPLQPDPTMPPISCDHHLRLLLHAVGRQRLCLRVPGASRTSSTCAMPSGRPRPQAPRLRGGTIIHEMSPLHGQWRHRTTPTGQTAAKNLAKRRRARPWPMPTTMSICREQSGVELRVGGLTSKQAGRSRLVCGA